MLALRVAGDALARVQERKRELAQRDLGVLVAEPHGLRGVDHRAAADGDEQVGTHAVEQFGAGTDARLAGLGLDVGDHVHRFAAQMPTHLVDGAAGLRSRVA